MFFKNLIQLCNDNNTTPNAVCLALGLSPAAATKWRSGAVPRETTLLKIANHFNVTVAELIGETSPALPEIHSNAHILDPAKTRNIPVYESVSAGFGVVAQNLILEYMPIYIPSESEASETICIKVTGDSMSPEIENGDIIQVHKQSSVDSGSIAVVLVDDEEALVKKVIYDDTHIELHSINPAYSPISFIGQNLMRIRILGLVKNTIKNPRTHRTEDKIYDKMKQMTPEQRKELENYIDFILSKK